ncbi:MAG: carbohydrate ABC transporter permease [Oscillospiraceae bacterium]
MSLSKNKHGMKRTIEDKIVDAVIFIFMTLLLIVCAYPFYYVIIVSLNEGVDAVRGGIYLWPRKFTISNYSQFLNDSKWIKAIFVSVAKTVIGTGLTVMFTCMVAYAFSCSHLMFRKFYTSIMMFCYFIGGGAIPYYLVLNAYGLINTFFVYVIPGMFSIYYCILARNFFASMPVELFESARLDGAGEFTIFTRIVLPLSKPILATLGLFTAVGQWNAWSDAVYYAPARKDLKTLASLMREVINKNQVDTKNQAAMMQASKYASVTPTSVQMAAMIIAVLPIICVYPFLQKHFVKGMMLGAVKG